MDWEDEKILHKAIDKWGIELQHLMTIEECAELTKEIIKEFRGKGRGNALWEEIADVSIMIDQLTIHHPEVKKIKIKKMLRLKKLVEESK